MLGQAVLGDAVHHHAAGLFHLLVDGHLVAALAQVIGRGQGRQGRRPRWRPSCRWSCGGLVELVGMGQDVVAQGALHRMDAHGVAVLALVAHGLAGVGAYPGGEHGHGVDAHDDLRGGVPVVLPDLLHVGGDVGAGGALGRAGVVVGLHAAHDGVVLVAALDGVALVAALAGAQQPAAHGIGIAVVPAAHVLAQVAAQGGGVADDGGGHAVGRLGNRLQLPGKGLGGLHLGQGGEGAHGHLVPLVQDVGRVGNGLQVDHQVGGLREDVLLQSAQQVGAAGNGLAVLALLQFLRGLLKAGRVDVFKVFHSPRPPLALPRHSESCPGWRDTR